MKKVWTILVFLCLMVGLCFALASCGEHEHTWDNGKVTKAATCEDVGVKTYTCTDCGETKTEDIAALGHDFAAEFTSDDTSHWHECSRCGVHMGAEEHTWDKGTVTKAAACTEKGSMTYKCTECDETKTEEIKALGHDFSAVYDKDENEHWQKCTRCSAEQNRGGHLYVQDDSTLVPATCNENGYVIRKCVCGDEQKFIIRATGEHVKGDTMAWDEEQHYYPCTGCGLHINPEKHTWTEGTVPDLSSTSCVAGAREDTCDVCGAKRTVSITSPKAHAFNYTLNSEEHTLSAKCPDCGKELEFTNVFVRDYEDKNIGDKVADSPSPGSVVREDTDGNLYGYLIHDISASNCAINMFTSKTELTEWTGASFRLKPWFTDADGTVRKTETFTLTFKADGEWKDGFGTVNYGPGNMLKVGSIQTDMEAELDRWYTFTYIYQKSTGILTIVVDNGERVSVAYGRSNNDKYMTSNVLSYWHMNVNAKAAVCLDDIMFFYADEMNVEVHEHAWNDGALTKPVTCQPGEMTYTCTVCGATKMEPVTDNMTAHNPGTEYFYTTPAETAGEPDVVDLVNHWHKCTVCGEVCGTEAHNWVEDMTKHQDPTSTSKGSATFTCVCGAEKTEDIEALHHIDASKWESDDKQHWNACTDEGCTDPKVNLADHDWTVKNVNKAPTCTEDGESVYVCSVCGKEKTEAVPAIGHKFGGAVHDSETGKVTFACEHDNCTETKVYVVSGNHAYDGSNALSIGTVNEVSYTKETDEDGNSYYLVKRETAGTTQPQTYYNYAVQKGAFYIEIAENGLRGASTFALNFYNTANSSSGTNNMKGNSKFETILHIEGGLIYKFNGTTGNAPIGKVEDGVKNRFLVEFEAVPADESNAAMINYTIYMNGELLTTGSMVNLLPNGEIAGLHVRVNLTAGNSFSFDNFYMMETPSED